MGQWNQVVHGSICWHDGGTRPQSELRLLGGGGVVIEDTSDVVFPAKSGCYTIEAWVKPSEHRNNGIVGWGDPSKVADLFTFCVMLTYLC